MSQSAAEKVRLKLEHDILTLNIKPGQRLDETKLAEIHGVSRTPVREALRQLSAMGLVEMRPHRGTVARRFSLGEIVEMFEMMAIMEGICARLAAKRAMHEQLQEIRRTHEACQPYLVNGDLNQYYDANEAFHEAIYRACGNAAILKQTLLLRDRLRPFRRYQLNRINRLKQSFSEHEQIVIAIENGAAQEAEQLIQDHLAVQSNFITTLVHNMPPDFLDDAPERITSLTAGQPKRQLNGLAADEQIRHAK